jgi:hypothetical protein
MKIEHKALTFALTLAVLVPACYITTEKPADSAPPVASSTATPAAAATNPPLVTATATATAVPTTPPARHPPSLPEAKPLPTTSAAIAPSASAKP